MNVITNLAQKTANGLNHLGSNIQLLASAEDSLDGFTGKFKELLDTFIPWVWGLVGAAALIWGIYIGVKFMTASKAEKKAEAKDYLKNFVIGIVLAGVVGVLGTFLIPAIAAWAGTSVR